jgi:hypothetical protein
VQGVNLAHEIFVWLGYAPVEINAIFGTTMQTWTLVHTHMNKRTNILYIYIYMHVNTDEPAGMPAQLVGSNRAVWPAGTRELPRTSATAPAS